VKLGALYGVGHQIIFLVMINYLFKLSRYDLAFCFCCGVALTGSALLLFTGATYCHLTASRYFAFHGHDVCMNHLRACSLFAFFCAITSFLSHG
jgi:hypothetical protein